MEIDKEPTPVIKGNVEKNNTILFRQYLICLLPVFHELITFYCLLFHFDLNLFVLLSRAQAYLKQSKINKILLSWYFFIYEKQHP